MKVKPKHPVGNITPKEENDNQNRSIQGISVIVPIENVCMDNQYTFTGFTVNGRVYSEVAIFEKTYGRSASSLRRDIDALTPENRSQYCLSVGKKQYINEGLLLTGKKLHKGWRMPSNPDTSNITKTRVGVMGEIRESVAFQLTQDLVVPITGITATNGVNYVELEAFASKHKVSVSSLRKDVKEIDLKNRWSQHRFRYVLTIDGKHFVSPAVLFFNGKRKYHRQLNNTDYAALLGQWDWDVAGTLRFNKSITEKKAVWMMQHLFTKLQAEYPGIPAYFAFVTERDPDGLGYHNHFVYGNLNKIPGVDISKVVNRIIEPFGGRYDYQCHIEDMRSDGYFLEYLVKKIHDREDGYGIEVCGF
jgi:hypothetical protein